MGNTRPKSISTGRWKNSVLAAGADLEKISSEGTPLEQLKFESFCMVKIY
jgi:hypothetical protein